MRQYTDIDTGHAIISVCFEVGRNGRFIITAFANGISVRCNLLHLDRMVDLFCDTVVAAAQFPADTPDKAKLDLATSLRAYIADLMDEVPTNR